MQITPHVQLIPGVIANPFLIFAPDGLVLVDTGLPRSQARIKRHLQQQGHALAALRHILITHADGDHVGGLKALKSASGAQVYASQVEADAIATGKMSRPLKLTGVGKLLFSLAKNFMRVQPVEVDVIVEAGQILPFLNGLEVLATPGHTPGHISFFSSQEGVLFAGDSLRSDGDTLFPSRGVNTWDEGKAQESARLQAELPARVVCVGHGRVVTEPAGKFRLDDS